MQQLHNLSYKQALFIDWFLRVRRQGAVTYECSRNFLLQLSTSPLDSFITSVIVCTLDPLSKVELLHKLVDMKVIQP